MTIVSTITTTLLLLAIPAWAQTSSTTSKPTSSPVPQPAPVSTLYVEVLRYVGGNGDNVPDPGERLDVFVLLRNGGTDPIKDVTGTMKIRSGGVTIVDGTSSWPDLPAGGAAETRAPFVIQISDSAARAGLCEGPPEIVPGATGSDTPVVSDGNTGVPTAESPNAGGAPDAQSSTEPGATGSGSTGSGTIEPAGTATSSPVIVEPVPTVPAEPPADAPVAFDAVVTVHTAGGSSEAELGGYVACAMDGVATSPPEPGSTTQGSAEKVAPVADFAASRAVASTRSSDAALVVIVLLAAVGLLVVRYRFMT